MVRVLVVEDEEQTRVALGRAFPAAHMEPVLAASGAEALDLIATGKAFDVALVDLMLPGISGITLAKHLRVQMPEVPVVLTSAYHLSASQLERTACGAVGFVPKPYKLEELCDFLRQKAKPPSSRRGR